MLFELLITLWLFFTGFLFCNYVFTEKSNFNKLIFSFPVSSIYTVLYIHFFSLSGLKIDVLIIVIFEFLKLICFYKIKYLLNFNTIKFLIYFAIVSLIPCFLIPWLTHDSAMFALYSKAIQNSLILKFPQAGLVSYGFFLSGLSTFYNYFTLSPFIVSIPFCFGMSFVLLLIKTLLDIFKKQKLNLKIWLLISVLITTPMFLLGFIYIHNNLISSFLIFSLIIILNRDDDSDINFQQILIFILTVGFFLTRMENGIIFSILLTFVTLFNSKILKYRIGIYFSIFYGYVWYSLMYYKTLEYSDVILSKNTTLIILLSLFILNILIMFIKKLKFFLNLLTIDKIIYSLILIIFFPFLIYPSEAFQSLKSLSLNAGLIGKWSLFWYIFLYFIFYRIIFLFDILKTKIPNERMLVLAICLLIFVLIYMMSFFRVPYRLGYGDSGNRLLIMIFPFAIQYIFLSLNDIKYKNKSFFFT